MSRRTPAGLIEYRTNYRWTVVVVTVFFLMLFFRFFWLQIVRGDEYREDQVASARRSERIPARRGLIVDRNGVILARDVESHDLIMRPGRVKDPDRTAELVRRLLHLNDEEDAQLRELISVGIEQRHRYESITIRRDLVSDYSPVTSAKLERLDPHQDMLWCSVCGRNYHQVSDTDTHCPGSQKQRLRWNEHRTGATCLDARSEYVAGTACPHDGAVLRERSYSLRCPDTGGLYVNERAILESHVYELPGFAVRASRRRIYPERNLMAHITGYMNQVTQRDLDKPDAPYLPGDRLGRAGVERALEKELRGHWGKRNTILGSDGNGPMVHRPDPENPDITVQDGLTVKVTIDVELQRIVRDAMRYHRSGASVIVQVETGEILAMYSKPTFDPNLWGGRLPASVYRSTINNPYSPLVNKALHPYAPGSVYKLVTAVAGLHLMKTDFHREVMCKGYYEFGGRRFRCHNRTGHGPLDLIHAMSRSCDIFFYRLGEELGMDTLAEYATKYFGFGRPTGIEIHESPGVVPDKDWHRKADRAWMPGFTLSTAVGQKDVRSTPLQVARAYAAFANGGDLRTNHIVRQLEDSEGNVRRVIRPRSEGRLPINEDEMAGLRDAFWRVVNDEHGTAFGARMDGFEASGKTGTAEAPEYKPGVSEDVAVWLKDDHAWFAGYAPSRKPEIAVAVFLDHGHSGGKYAAPVAMKIFKGYFTLKAREPAEEPSNSEPLPNPITTSPKPVPGKINDAPIDL
ncbi:MAG: penicillin-binding protein 2 [Myxococcota bacterium]|jgi:penicillin-binding protein 2